MNEEQMEKWERLIAANDTEKKIERVQRARAQRAIFYLNLIIGLPILSVAIILIAIIYIIVS